MVLHDLDRIAKDRPRRFGAESHACFHQRGCNRQHRNPFFHLTSSVASNTDTTAKQSHYWGRGFTSQYVGLEKIHEKYRDHGLVILGFPANNFLGQEPGTNEEWRGCPYFTL
jgi:hypothetical protein